MTWGYVAVAAATVVGSAMQADAASSAADTQAGATRDANALQKYEYDTSRADNAQYRNTGTAANQRLATLLGLGGSTRDQLRTQLLPQYTSQSSQNGSPGNWINVRGAMGDQTAVWRNPQTGEQVEGANPGQTPGAVNSSVNEQGLNAALDARMQAQGSNDPAFGSLLKPFDQTDLNNDLVYQNGLQFGLSEGEKGINRQAAATGSSLSGATLKALTRYGNDYATTKTEGAYNRNNINKQQTFNMLSGVSGTGQVANAQTATVGMNYANQAGNNLTALGNARGASAIAQGKALSGGINGIANAYQRNALSTPSTGWSGGYDNPGGYYQYGGSNLDVDNYS